MAKKQCQSCGMPLKLDSTGWGTNADGSKSNTFCIMCYEHGNFTKPEIDSGEKMQQFVFELLRAKHIPKFLVKLMIRDIPKLERWNK
jgi:hypothetical protein